MHPSLRGSSRSRRYTSGESDWEILLSESSEEDEEEEEEEEEEEKATPISISSRESEGTMTRRGHFSATESEDKGSSTGTTPKESQRKLVFHHKNQSPPGHALFWCIVGGSPSHGQGRHGKVPRALLAG